MSEFSEKRRKVCVRIWRALRHLWRIENEEILREKIPMPYQYQVSKSVETVPITFVTAKVYNRWLSTFTNRFWWSATFFSRARNYRKEEAEDLSTSWKGQGEFAEALPRTILREDLLLKIRSRFDCTIDSSPGFKRCEEKVVEWRLVPLLSFSSSLLFSFPFLFEPSPHALENRHSNDDRSFDFADQCRIAAFMTRRFSRQRRREILNIAFFSSNLPLGKIEFHSLEAHSVLILYDRDSSAFFLKANP